MILTDNFLRCFVGGILLMHKLWILFLFLLPLFMFAEEKNQSLEAEIHTPIVVSLANKQDGGEWELVQKPDSLKIENKRKGYLYTYFILKSQSPLQGMVAFSYQQGRAKDDRTYFIRILDKENKENPSSKIESWSAKEKNELVVVAEKNKPSSYAKVPENMKAYIVNLIEEELYNQALIVINQEEEKDEKKDLWWLTQKKIEILEKQKKIDEMIAFVNNALEEQKEDKAHPEKEFYLRLAKAQAFYQGGKKEEALSELVFIKNYFPHHPTIYYELGKFYFKENIKEKGVALFEHLATRFIDPPAKDEVYFTLAQYYYQVVGLNGYNLSHKYYKKTLESGMTSRYYNEAFKMSQFLEKNFINIR